MATTTIQPDLTDVEDDRSIASLPTATDIDDVAKRIRCLNDHMLVKLEERPKMAGLIHLPDTARHEEPRWALVIKVGPGAWLQHSDGRAPTEVRPGDRVLLSRDPGWELAGGYRMLRVGAAMAVERLES